MLLNACVLVLRVDMGSMAKTQVDQKAGKLLRIIIIMNECFYHHFIAERVFKTVENVMYGKSLHVIIGI